MLRHEFQPGRLVAGIFLTVAGVMYAGDAGGAWETPWFVVIPLVVGGLCLAGATGVLGRAIRRRGTDRSRPGEARPEPRG
ncbi:drug/metabolite transporter (DMT)-like permease [Streptomyces glaucescens]